MPYPPLLLVPLLLILLWAFITYDSIVRIEYAEFTEEWKREGEPVGMIWKPEGYRRTLRSGLATQRCMLVWLFKNPSWANSSENAVRLLRRYCVLVLGWSVGVLGWFFGMQFLFG